MGRRSKSNRNPPPSGPAPAARAEPRGAWRRHFLLVTALWAAALAVYSNSFQAGLVFDSRRAILGDSRIQAATAANTHLIWNEDYWYRTGSGGLYRPLSTLSYLFNYAILGDGPQPAGYHGVNFCIHALNIALAYLLGLLVFGEAWPAFALAAIWALHPVLTESVTNVVGRADLLAAFGVLAGLLCYARSLTGAGRRRAGWLVALAGASGIGVFSKESGVVLLGVMAAYDIALARKASWLARACGYAAASLAPVVYLVMRSRVLAHVSSLVISYCDNPLTQSGFWTARITAVKVLGKYLWLMLWPARLSCDYSYNQVPLFGWRMDHWEDAKAVIAVLMWIAVGAAAIFAWRRARPVFFFVGFFAVTIAPVSNLLILIGSIMAERFLYLPSIAFAGCVVWAARAIWRRAPARWQAAPLVLPAALMVALVALGARTYARNLDWRDERSLWTSAVRVSPESYKTHSNMANLFLSQPRPDLAAATGELEKSLAILDPLPHARNVPSVYATAGFCDRMQGHPEKALEVLLRGREIDRAWNDAVALRNRLDGKASSMVGTPSLYLDLGRVYLTLDAPDRAIEALRFGRLIDPEPEFFEELAQAYQAKGQPEEAITSLLEGLTVDSSQTRLASAAVQLYRETAPQSCAVASVPGGFSLNLQCPLVRTQLCTASRNMVLMYRQMSDPESAAATAGAAVQGLGCPAEMFR